MSLNPINKNLPTGKKKIVGRKKDFKGEMRMRTGRGLKEKSNKTRGGRLELDHWCTEQKRGPEKKEFEEDWVDLS